VYYHKKEIRQHYRKTQIQVTFQEINTLALFEKMIFTQYCTQREYTFHPSNFLGLIFIYATNILNYNNNSKKQKIVDCECMIIQYNHCFKCVAYTVESTNVSVCVSCVCVHLL